MPNNLFLARQVLAERFSQEEKARKLLQQLKARYPKQALIEEVDRYLAFLDKLVPPSAARAADQPG